MFRLLRISRSAWKWRSRYKDARQSIFKASEQSIFKAPQQTNKTPPQATPEQTKTSSPQPKHKGPSDAETAQIAGCFLVFMCGLLGWAYMYDPLSSRPTTTKARAEHKKTVDEPVRFELVARGIVKDDRGNVYEGVEPEFGPGLGLRVITPVRRSVE